MEGKIFKGNNFKEVIEKIKSELGKDAIIHSTKISEKRNFLLFGKRKKIFEVKASGDNKIPDKSTIGKDTFYDEIKNLEIGKDYEGIYEQLIENEIDPVLAKSMILNFSIRIPSELPYSQKIESMREMVKNFLKECLVPESPILDKVSVFLGPTGVGKTLSIIKIATDLKIKKKKKVSIISLDFIKIGNEEQIKKYSEILNIPFETALTPNHFENILKIYENESDFIFIDTPGMSPNDKELISQTLNFLNNKNTTKILVLSASTNLKELYHIWKNFESFNINKIGITKLDEIKTCGHFLKFLIDFKIPVLFITVGRKISEDIKFINSNDLLITNLLRW